MGKVTREGHDRDLSRCSEAYYVHIMRQKLSWRLEQLCWLILLPLLPAAASYLQGLSCVL
jgi:hypothetical protein